jgi:hypothetical protein
VREPSLLVGLLFDTDGERLTPTHAVKNGRRYRYYISRGLIAEAGNERASGIRTLGPAMLRRLNERSVQRSSARANQGLLTGAVVDGAPIWVKKWSPGARGRHTTAPHRSLWRPARIGYVKLAESGVGDRFGDIALGCAP